MKKNYKQKFGSWLASKVIKAATAMLCLTASVGIAQPISCYVGTGTNFNQSYQYPAPYGNYYWFSKNQMFITAAELTASGIPAGVPIQSLALNVQATNGSAPNYLFTITVFTTTLTDPLVTTMVTTGQVSSSGPAVTYVPFVGWNTHTITPFTWNGTDNIVIEVCQANPSQFTSNCSTYWTDNLQGASIKTRWFYQDYVTVCQNSGNVGSSSTTRPNVRIDWLAQPCQGTPGANTITATSTTVCPVFGTSNLGLANTYTVGGIIYQWQQSNNLIGPYVPAAGTNSSLAYATPTLAGTTYYQMAAYCANGGSTLIVNPIAVQVAPTTTNTVPYFESFEGITQAGQLPNCSWIRSDNAQCATRTASLSTWRKARTGNKFAEFDASNFLYGNTRYFWSNGILLNAGITYSASVWYANQGNTTWNNFSLMYGSTQTQNGLTNLATAANPASTTYMPLSNTFMVATTGIYYMCIKATEAYWGAQTVWDDLSVIAPCQFTNNAANINLASAASICAGQTVNITASGANSYTWTNGPQSNTLAVAPLFNTTYTVTGINPLSGCLGSATKEIVVNQLPPVSIVPSKTSVCDGESVTMQAFAGNSYTWSAGPAFTSVITVTPTMANNSYTVIASNPYGCTAKAIQQIDVNPLPVISVSGSTMICAGYAANLTGNGAGANGTYEWKSPSLYLQANPVSITPNTTTSYSVVGTTTANCKSTYMLVVAVDICLGIENVNGTSSKVSVYPNPNAGIFTVSLNNGLNKTIEVVDVTGRIVLSNTTSNNVTDVNISTLANGVYYVKVKSESISEVIKVVKQ